MANMFGVLLAAVLVIFILARVMKDAKAFGKLMAWFTIALIVGAGVKTAVAQVTSNITPETTTVVSTESVPMHNTNTTPFVSEEPSAYLDCASKDITERDSVETKTESLPTSIPQCAYLDDS